MILRKLLIKSIVNNIDKRTYRDLLREYFNKWKRLTNLNQKKDYYWDKKKIINK